MVVSMYRELARYYDLLYSSKDYRTDAIKIKKFISRYKKTKGDSLLDVACGTGQHIKFLKDSFSCMGIDLNKEVLRIAKRKFPDVEFKRADMINFKLNRKFDVVLCLFSAIGYVRTYDNLRKTFNNFSDHLKSGGVLIIEPWFTSSMYHVGTPHMATHNGKDIKIARLNISEKKNGVSILNMHHLIAEKNKKIKYIVSREELGLFDTRKTLNLMRKAGLNAKVVKGIALDPRRGLILGIKG